MNLDVALDIAIKHTVDKYRQDTGISTYQLANSIGIKSQAVFLNKVCATNLNNRFTDKQLIQLQVVTGNDTISQVMGKIVTARIKDKGPTAQDITELLLSVPIQAGEMIKVITESLADGEIDRNELEQSLKKIHAKIETLQALKVALKNKAGMRVAA